jgi:DeoR/GlpR family transcriptional regulator of sugar metabolism
MNEFSTSKPTGRTRRQAGESTADAERSSLPLAAQRHAAILERVQTQGGARVRELMRELGVSDMTIRRDIEALAERGLVQKVHGGVAALSSPATDEPGFKAKSTQRAREKDAIARRAAAFVSPGSAVALSAGTTTWRLAQQLVTVPDITVVTNSIPVAEVLYAIATPLHQTVILSGGVRTPSDALVGPFAVSAIRSLNIDQLFLGVHGMSVERGFTTPNFLEAEIDQAFVEAARSVIVLADHTKWDTIGLSTICALSDVDVLISNDALDPDAREAIEAAVGELIIVETATAENGASG